MRYAVLVYNPDDELVNGRIVGAYETAGRAEQQATRIRWAAERVDIHVAAVVLPMLAGTIGARRVVMAIAHLTE